MTSDQKEEISIQTYKEFTAFAYDVLGKKNKKISNLYKLVAKPETLTDQQIEDIKKTYGRCFQNLEEWENFSGKHYIEYKTGYLSLGELERQCKKDEEDFETFKQFMSTIQALHTDIKKSLMQFLKKLDLDEDSGEAKFMTSLFNELGGGLLEGILNSGDMSDMGSILPKLLSLVQSGRITEILGQLKTGDVKLSKILNAFSKLLQNYENSQAIENVKESTPETITDVVSSSLTRSIKDKEE